MSLRKHFEINLINSIPVPIGMDSIVGLTPSILKYNKSNFLLNLFFSENMLHVCFIKN
jgi:hypothetical protein